MTVNENKSSNPVDASLRVPLLALFGGAALWLVLGALLALIASIKFHAPTFLSGCAWLTYGRVLPAANDALLYGFCIPAGLGVVLWVFARLSDQSVRGAIVPVVAANLWHLGVLVGLVGIFIGQTTGFTWIEFPRGGSSLLFFSYLLLAMWAMMSFTGRKESGLFPTHWFVIGALLWFPWIYSTANLFLVEWPVRGVAQAVIGWWFANNLIFIWLSLVGLGLAFYFLAKFSGRPLQTYYVALFAFWTLILFGTWLGIPQSAPVPAWLPTASSTAAILFIVPLLAFISIIWKSTRKPETCQGGSFCFVKIGAWAFLISAFMLMISSCPHFGRVMDFTWFGVAQTQLHIFGFFAMILFGAIYHLLPKVMDAELPFPKFAKLHFWLMLAGVALLVIPLALAGIEQGTKLADPAVPFATVSDAALKFLRISTLGLLFIFIGGLLFAANIFVMTLKWKLALAKSVIAAVKAPLEPSEVKS